MSFLRTVGLKTSGILIAALIAFASVPAMADTKIAIIDVQRVLDESAAAQSIQTQIEENRKLFQEELSEHEKELRETQKELAENDISQEEMRERRQNFESQLLETRKLVQQRRRTLEQAANKALTQLREEITKIVASMADKEGYDLILTRQNVILADKDMDLTDEVMETLNKTVTKIELNLEN